MFAGAEEDAEISTQSGAEEIVQEVRDLFDEMLPIEIRLSVFASLVQSFVDELRRLKDAGEWSTVEASRSKWVGWDGGIRELIKLSRVSYLSFPGDRMISVSHLRHFLTQVSRTWQALVFEAEGLG